ncbi:MAG: CHAT domain-containing protein [Mojavia pulchra JT2-VF2]|jgi:CHAT domain-containing protein/Flp pilus assembly protein TadD|uniref:CHAT domain-containing protein n=1 Tax=Mojavia pulchra JT2-VF2 TaxID=287848 RepID=A0A951Q2Q2_9NOST|nr:CHAT domain-containing protein [Mojavia pulchra JT2-VF2]
MPSFAKFNHSLFLGIILLSDVAAITPLSLATTPENIGVKIAQNIDSTPAKKVFEQADKLREQGTAESLKQAIEKYQEALQLYRAVGDKVGEATTLKDMGSAYRSLGEYQKALDLFNQSLVLFRSVGDRSGEAKNLNNIGLAYSYLGEKQKALDFYNQALSLRRAVGDKKGEASTLNNMGNVYSDWGEKQKALDFYNQALPLRQAVGDKKGEADTLYEIGNVYSDLGEEQKALDFYNQALPLRRAVGDKKGEAGTLNGIGNAYSSLGEKQKALALYKQAVLLFQALGDRRGASIPLVNIVGIYSRLGEKQKMLEFYKQYRAFFPDRAEEYKLEHPEYYNNIGVIYDRLGERKKAIEFFNQALSRNRADGNLLGVGRNLSNIGWSYSRLGEKQKALDFFNQSLPLWRAGGNRQEEAYTLYDMAKIERDRGNLEQALTQIEASVQIIEFLRTKVASPELCAAYFAQAQKRYQFYIDLLMQLHKINPTQGYDSKALAVSERARARTLLELLSEANADIRTGVDATLLAQERNLQQQLSAKEQQRVQILGGKYTQAQKTAIETEIANLLTEYQNIQDQIRATSPRYAALTQPQPLTLPEIQQQVLDDNTLLLQYSLGEERSYLWAVTKTGITSYELPKRADIEALTKRFQQEELVPAHQRIRKPQDAKASTVLSKILLQPVAKLLGNQRLVIVADGALQYIPFAALPSPASTNAQDAKEYLIFNHEIVSLPSASTLAVLRKETANRKAPRKTVALIADPVFSLDDERLQTTVKSAQNQNSDIQALALSRASAESDVNLSRLNFTRTEAEAITALLPPNQTKKVLDFAASRNAATSSELAQYQIVHFATHGILNSKNPELSGIVLSLFDQNGNPQNGFLRLHDIYNLNLPVELVVLSACQTGLGKEIKGEGLVGMTRGFMYAGAPRVVVSLWDVQDQATSELMKRFYQKMLSEKLKPAAALRAAQIEMLKEKQWKLPYYWAAFLLQGEWN